MELSPPCHTSTLASPLVSSLAHKDLDNHHHRQLPFTCFSSYFYFILIYVFQLLFSFFFLFIFCGYVLCLMKLHAISYTPPRRNSHSTCLLLRTMYFKFPHAIQVPFVRGFRCFHQELRKYHYLNYSSLYLFSIFLIICSALIVYIGDNL